MPTRNRSQVTIAMPSRAKNPRGFTHRVLVADALAASRAGIRAAMAPHGFAVAAEAADLDSAVQAARDEGPDVCLLSLALSEDAIGAVRAVREAAPDMSIVALADEESEEEALAILAAGASGYLPRAGALKRLPAVLNAAIEGQAVAPTAIMNRIAKRAEHERRDALWRGRPRTALSPRERQVLEGLREGKTTAEIAVALGVSAVTVRRYVSGVLRKAGVTSREALGEMLSGRDVS